MLFTQKPLTMKIHNLLLIVFLMTLVSCGNTEKPEIVDLVESSQQTFKDGIFLHISSGYDNPKKVLMALSLANKMAESKDVCLFFDIDGVYLLTKTAEDMQMENYMSLHEAINKLVEQNVIIMACPMCTKAAGIAPEDYKEGIIIAEKEKFFDFTKGRILSLDY
jgi:predicted peroxiredoxin